MFTNYKRFSQMYYLMWFYTFTLNQEVVSWYIKDRVTAIRFVFKGILPCFRFI